MTSVTDTINWGTAQSDNVVTVYFVKEGESRTFASGESITSEGFNAYEKNQFQQAFDKIASVCGLTFNIVTGTSAGANADLQMVLDTNEISAMPSDDQFLGYFNPPGETYEGIGVFNGDLWDRSSGGDLTKGGFGYVTIVHELLHGLGLAHPHDNGGSSTIMQGVTSAFDDYGKNNLNQGVYTTMTYNSGYQTGALGSAPGFNDTYGYEAGPMALDIAVLQELYGTVSRNTGNTTYYMPDANKAGTMWKSIWDTKGFDAIRYDGTRDVDIDLRPATLQYGAGAGGFISAAKGIAGGYTIANGVTIEKAMGGGGDDDITGNNAANVLMGRNGRDTINGGDGGDDLYGGGGIDTLNGNNGKDDIFGGDGNDRITGGGKNDVLRGEAGNDTVQGGDDNDRVWGGYGADNLKGGAGKDVLGGGNGKDKIWGGGGHDTLGGGDGDDRLYGGNGDDVLEGNANSDRLIGGAGRDILRGGNGNDVFDFNKVGESGLRKNADVIGDFNAARDRIDLRSIDADVTSGGNQNFDFRGKLSFNDAGQVRAIKRDGDTVVQISTDNDKSAEMEIILRGNHNLTADDFIL